MNTKICTKCKSTKTLDEFYFVKSRARYASRCKICERLDKKNWRSSFPDKVKAAKKRYADKNQYRWKEINKRRNDRKDVRFSLLSHAKKRAQEYGIPFAISREDITIPDYCPVLGIKIVQKGGKTSDNSPSIDRIIPALGYVKGNVMVISWRANAIKRNGTAEEHEKIAQYIRNFSCIKV